MPDYVPPSRTRPGQERFVAPLEETPLQAVDAIDVDAVPESQWKEAWKRLRVAPLFWVSSAIILMLAVVIAFPGLFTDVDPNYKQLSESFNPPREGHPFGFTQQGGDVWARTLYGARASVAVGVLSTLLVAVVGIRWAIGPRPRPRVQCLVVASCRVTKAAACSAASRSGAPWAR